MFDLTAYLARIGLEKPVEISASGLETLYRAHGCNVPWENFDVVLGLGVSLEEDDLFDKIVVKGRGGYCFEQNEIFLLALNALGFKSQRLLARLHLPQFPASRVHEMILVDADGSRWLTDVGGGWLGPRAPIPFVLNHPVERDGEVFRLTEAAPFGTMFQVQQKGVWRDVSSFDLEHVSDADLAMSNYYCSTNRALIFSQKRIAAINRPDGGAALMDVKLREVSGGQDKTTTLESGEPYLAALKEHFGIVLDPSYEEAAR